MDPTTSAYSDIQDHEIETDSEPIGLELEQPMDTDVVENTLEDNICSEKKPPSRTSVSRTSSASSARSFRIYKETSNARNQNSTCVESRCVMENIINSATTFSEDINKKLEYVSPNVSPRNNCSTPQLPKIGKRHDTPNSSSFSDHIQLTSEVQLHVTGREMSPRAEKHPQHSFSVGNVLSKAGLPIKKKSKLGSHWPTSNERLPRYSKVYSSPPSHRNNYYTDEIRNVPNSELTCHSPNCKSPLSKATTPTKNLINSSERLKVLSTPKKVLDDKDMCSENYLEKTSSFSNPSSPLIRSQIKQWNGLSEKDTLVHSLISNTQDEEELKTLKYKLGSMLSYENKKTKPPLLETMENFIVTELQSVKSQMTQDNYNDIEFQIAKAQAYKECMKIYIDHSRTYGPILSTAIHEMSTTIESLRDHIMSFSTRNENVNIPEENAVKAHRIYRETSNEIALIKQQNAELERQVSILKSNEKALLHTIDKLGMDLKLHEKRRIDEIKRGMLLNDAIQHRENKEVEIKKQLSEMKSVANEKSKIERMYQESIMELDKRSDMVPKGEYQRLRDMNDQLENELNSLKVKFSQEQRVSKLLNEKMNEIKLTNNMMEEKLLDLSRSHTPRPKWSEIRQDLKVDSLPLDSSTSGNVNQLLQRMTKLQALIRKQQRELQENAKALEFLKTEDIIKSRMYSSNFIGQGTGPSVPKYLKFRGKVRNKKFRKKEIMNVLSEVWKIRAKSRENENQPRDSFADFFDGFISMKVGKVGSIRAELAYNIVFGCDHYSWDMDCYLFLKILRNEVSELTYFAMTDMIEKLYNSFVKLDETEGGRVKGTVLKKNANKQLELFFQGKLDDDILKLKVEMHKDEPNNVINYEKLFQPDADGFDSRFLTTVKRQFITHVEEYNIDCAEWLREKEEREGTLSVKRVYEIFDYKQVSKNSLEKTIRIGLDIGLEDEIKWDEPVNIDTFMKNIQAKMLLTRTTFRDTIDPSVFDIEIENELETIDVSNQELV